MLGKIWKLIAIFYLLNIRTSKDLFGTKMCKVTFGLKYLSMNDKIIEPKLLSRNCGENMLITTDNPYIITYVLVLADICHMGS